MNGAGGRSLSHVAKAVRLQLWQLLEWAIADLGGPAGFAARRWYWRRRLGGLGRNVRFGVGVKIYEPGYVRIGNECWIDDYVIIRAGPIRDASGQVYRKTAQEPAPAEGEVIVGNCVHIAQYVLLQGHGGLRIGNSLTIAAGAKVLSLSHHHRDLSGKGTPDTIWKFSGLAPPEEQALILGPTIIADNAAVGLQSVVLPGSTIGHNSWLGAQSLLRGDLPDNVIASGNPATITGRRSAGSEEGNTT